MKAIRHITVFIKNNEYTIVGVTDGQNSIPADVSASHKLDTGALNIPTLALRDALQKQFGLRCVRIVRDDLTYSVRDGWYGFFQILGKVVTEPAPTEPAPAKENTMPLIIIEATIGTNTFVPADAEFDQEHVYQFEAELEDLIADEVEGCTFDDIVVNVTVLADNSEFTVTSVSIPDDHPALAGDYDEDILRTHIENVTYNAEDAAWERTWS